MNVMRIMIYVGIIVDLRGELASVTILKYLNLHLIKGSNKFNFNNNIKVVNLKDNKWNNQDYGNGDSKDIFLWSANIKNYTNWNSNPLRYKSKNSGQTIYTDFAKSDIQMMDKTVQKINKVNGNYIPLILSPLYFTENNYKSIENDLKEFYQNHYLFIENNNADAWGSAAKNV